MDDFEEDRLLRDRKEKQLFLKKEIIEKGYDGAEFSQFLSYKRPDGGENIDMWSFGELNKLVREYKKHADEQRKVYEQTQQPYETLDAETQLSTTKEEPAPEAEVPELLKDDNIKEVLTVKVSDSSPLNDERWITIKVDEPELVKGGLLSASYVQYTVITKPFGWAVKRRFSDFLWLRSTLQKLHLGYLVPPVPQKKNKGQFENDFIGKRMYFLERFINDCVNHEDLKSDAFLYFFLSLSDDDQFRARIKEAERLPKIARIDEISNVHGRIGLEISSDLKIYTSYVRELFTQTETFYEKLRKLSKKMSIELEQTANTLFGLEECYTAMHANLKAFNESAELGKQPGLEGYYSILNNMVKPWGQQFMDQAKLVRKNMSHFYKYAYYENEAYKELVYARIKTGNDYLQRKKDLIAKKEKLFQQGDISKWEMAPNASKNYTKDVLLKNKVIAFDLMLAKETETVKELRDLFAYQNIMMFNEINSGMKDKIKQNTSNFHELAENQAEIMTQVHVHWAKLMSFFADENRREEAPPIRKPESRYDHKRFSSKYDY